MAKNKKVTKKKEVDKLEQLKNISSNKIIVKVYKDFGSNTAILKAEYEAEERRDTYNNLVSINKEFLHDENTDFSIDDVYYEMQVLLEFKNKNKEDKINLLEQKIKHQNRLIVLLEKYPELNSIYNYADENLKLHDYRLLKEYTQNIIGQGAYFTIEKGKRVYCFDSVDGFLVPIWRGISTHTQYPDHTRKKKIVIQEDIILQQEIQRYSSEKKVQSILTWGLIAITILFGLLLWGGLKVLEMHNNIQSEIQGSAYTCVEQTAEINKLFSEAVANKLISIKEEENIKEQVKQITPATLK